jgi:excisionase family DNA binding protein
MAQRDVPTARAALARVLKEATGVFDALLAPYELPSRVPPGAPIGPPVKVPYKAGRSEVRAIADRKAREGLSSWYLHQVAEREAQLRKFVGDYRKGLYKRMPSADWLGMVERFRDAVLTDIHTAQQAPRGWDRRALGGTGKQPAGSPQDLLTPGEIAPELGIGERSVRRRIQEGRLGPWRKEGTRWVIGRDEFMRYWAARLLDSDMPRPT